jgi:hypothetical protein
MTDPKGAFAAHAYVGELGQRAGEAVERVDF